MYDVAEDVKCKRRGFANLIFGALCELTVSTSWRHNFLTPNTIRCSSYLVFLYDCDEASSLHLCSASKLTDSNPFQLLIWKIYTFGGFRKLMPSSLASMHLLLRGGLQNLIQFAVGLGLPTLQLCDVQLANAILYPIVTIKLWGVKINNVCRLSIRSLIRSRVGKENGWKIKRDDGEWRLGKCWTWYYFVYFQEQNAGILQRMFFNLNLFFLIFQNSSHLGCNFAKAAFCFV